MAENPGGTVVADAVQVVRDNGGDTNTAKHDFSYTYRAPRRIARRAAVPSTLTALSPFNSLDAEPRCRAWPLAVLRPFFPPQRTGIVAARDKGRPRS